MYVTIAQILIGCISTGQTGPLDVEPNVMKAFDSKDVMVRRDAAMHFQLMFRDFPRGFSPSKEMFSVLLKALNDPDPEVRQHVANTFSKFGDAAKPAVPLLATLLDDKEAKVRRAAAGALLELGPLSRDALPSLASSKKDRDKLVRLYTGVAVARLKNSEQELRFLLDFSTDKDEAIRNEAANVFFYIGLPGIPILKAGIRDKNPEIRAWTIGAFIAMIKNNAAREKFPLEMVPLIASAIDDENKVVVQRGIYAASQLGDVAKEAIPAIIKRFKDPDWQIREYAIRHVVDFGSASELAVPALRSALMDGNVPVQEAAARSLEIILKRKKVSGVVFP